MTVTFASIWYTVIYIIWIRGFGYGLLYMDAVANGIVSGLHPSLPIQKAFIPTTV